MVLVRLLARCASVPLLCITTLGTARGGAGCPDNRPVNPRVAGQAPGVSRTITLPVVDGKDIRFTRISTEEGLSQTKVSQIVQDDQGFMWFGTQYGLNRFDGYQFKVFKREILPPWWNTWWFRAVCVAVSITLLWVVYRWRTEQLQRQKKQLRDVINTVPANVWSTLPDGAVDFINQRWQEFAGLPLEDALGWNWEVVIHPEDRSSFVANWRAALKDRQSMESEVRVRRAGGEYRWFFIRNVPLHDERGNITKWYGTGIDITDRKRAEEDLRSAETRFRTYVDHATDAFFVLDIETGGILDVNRRACENLGYARDEVIGKTAVFFDVDVSLEWIRDNLRPRLEAGESVTFETHHRRKDGTVFPVEFRSRRFEYAGRIVALSLALDITERKRTERERERLRQLEADLAHMNRVGMMGELAASLAHELSQPITPSITGAKACSRWLDRELPDLERARAAVVRIEKDGTRAAEIINRLRSFYKKGTPPQRELVDINEVASEILVLLRPEATRHSISLRTDLANVPQVAADRVQLQQVFMNLMLNAIEAMQEAAGDLTVTSQMDRDGQVLISISDTGVGLPADRPDQIFEAFYTTKPQGTGMGLAITRSIIESYGGRLWATANIARGATFHFSLPREMEGRA